jgi:hypothetical protein
MSLKVVAITPKKALVSAKAAGVAIDDYLHSFAKEFVKEMQEYPPELPWRSRTPRSGPRIGGRRTGAYGEGWTRGITYSKSSVTIVNPVSYAVVVGGSRRQSPGQARALASRGWKSVQDVGPEVNRRVLPRFSKVIVTGRV